MRSSSQRACAPVELGWRCRPSVSTPPRPRSLPPPALQGLWGHGDHHPPLPGYPEQFSPRTWLALHLHEGPSLWRCLSDELRVTRPVPRSCSLPKPQGHWLPFWTLWMHRCILPALSGQAGPLEAWGSSLSALPQGSIGLLPASYWVRGTEVTPMAHCGAGATAGVRRGLHQSILSADSRGRSEWDCHTAQCQTVWAGVCSSAAWTSVLIYKMRVKMVPSSQA